MSPPRIKIRGIRGPIPPGYVVGRLAGNGPPELIKVDRLAQRGNKGLQGPTGPQGPAGANGSNGTNGVGVPTGGTAGQVLAKIDGVDYNTQWVNPATGGVTAFTGLSDVPSSYTGQAGKAVRVNAGESGLEFFTISGSGTVTSVDLSVPSFLSVSGNPVTTSGTLAVTLATQSANAIFAGPTSGGAAAPTFRAMVTADIPNGIVTEAKLSFSNNTTANVSTSAHGLCPILPNDATKYLDGTGAFSVPAGTSQAGRLIGVQIITATGSGTYTPTSGTASIVIELVGGGGGGSGVGSPGATFLVHGQGGGAGAYLRKRLTSNFSGASYVVGAKGNGGTNAPTGGGAGSNTTFTTTGGSPVTYTAAGGNGGGRNTITPPGQLAGVAGGAGTNGDINVSGEGSWTAYATSTAFSVGSKGGSSHLGVGGLAGIITANGTSTAGNAASGYGAGGSGAQASTTGGAQAGGNGSDGIIIIWEYS